MRALFISNDRSIPDVASATRARMQEYADRIGEMHVVLRGAKARTTNDGAITIHEFRISRFLVPFMLQRHARILIKKHAIEVVSAQDPFEHGWVAMRAVRDKSAKLHIQVHTDFLSPWYRQGYTPTALVNHIRVAMADIVLPKADGIRVVSERVKRSLVARYGDRIVEPVVIPIAVPDAEEPSHAAPPFTFTLVAVSRLVPEKRVGDILRVLATVRKRYPNTGLVIAGDGPERMALRQLAVALHLTDHVRFLGARADIASVLKSGHAFVHASEYEGYGLVLLEAALAGVPIVSTDVGLIGDVLKPNVHALVTHVHDVMQMARNVEQLIEDNALRTALSLAAHQAAQEHREEYRNQPEMVANELKALVA